MVVVRVVVDVVAVLVAVVVIVVVVALAVRQWQLQAIGTATTKTRRRQLLLPMVSKLAAAAGTNWCTSIEGSPSKPEAMLLVQTALRRVRSFSSSEMLSAGSVRTAWTGCR